MPYLDPEKQREYFRRYHITHREKKCASAKRWREANPEPPEEKRARSKTDYQENRDKRVAKHKEWRAANAESISIRMKRYNQSPAVVARNKARREERREILNEQARRNYQKNRARKIKHLVALNRRRAAQRKINGGHFTGEQWIDLCAHYNHTCLCCGRTEPDIVLTADHVIPLSRGGSNDISNIQPLCRGCNAKKHTKTIDYRPQSCSALTIPLLASANQPGPAEELNMILPFTAASASL